MISLTLPSLTNCIHCCARNAQQAQQEPVGGSTDANTKEGNGSLAQ